MNYREKRLLELMNNMPQANGETNYDAVVPVVEFNFSDHPDPDKARKQNIKKAIKALNLLSDGIHCPVRNGFRSLVVD